MTRFDLGRWFRIQRWKPLLRDVSVHASHSNTPRRSRPSCDDDGSSVEWDHDPLWWTIHPLCKAPLPRSQRLFQWLRFSCQISGDGSNLDSRRACVTCCGRVCSTRLVILTLSFTTCPDSQSDWCLHLRHVKLSTGGRGPATEGIIWFQVTTQSKNLTTKENVNKTEPEILLE